MHDSDHIDDFEHYLQHQVSEHRMYPSDRVWRNIRTKIQTPKKWPALSVFTVLIISALVVGTILNKPVPDSVTPNFVYSLQSPAIQPQKLNEEVQNEQLAEKSYSIEELTSRTITAAAEKVKIDEDISIQQLTAANYASSLETSSPQNLTQNSTITTDNISPKPSKNVAVVSGTNSYSSFKNIDDYLFDVSSRLRSILNTEPLHQSKGGVAFFTSARNDIAYNNFDFKVSNDRREFIPSLNQLGKTSSRFDFRFYVAPSVSYRRLKEKSQDASADKASSAVLESDYNIDPSKAINHSPAIGYETGLGLGYKLNKNLTLTGGFQFNISQYKINAFLYKDEPVALTLDEGDYASTVNTVSSLRSISGTTPLTIKNRYYQISMPIGLEWKMLQSGKFSWSLGTSIQPTYTFDKQPLIISSNYKNYADGSAYVRNWNINANAETFLGYQTGTYRWQIGPQVRYQMLPSLVDKYPNREYLFNYGLKLGVVKQLK